MAWHDTPVYLDNDNEHDNEHDDEHDNDNDHHATGDHNPR